MCDLRIESDSKMAKEVGFVLCHGLECSQVAPLMCFLQRALHPSVWPKLSLVGTAPCISSCFCSISVEPCFSSVGAMACFSFFDMMLGQCAVLHTHTHTHRGDMLLNSMRLEEEQGVPSLSSIAV